MALRNNSGGSASGAHHGDGSSPSDACQQPYESPYQQGQRPQRFASTQPTQAYQSYQAGRYAAQQDPTQQWAPAPGAFDAAYQGQRFVRIQPAQPQDLQPAYAGRYTAPGQQFGAVPPQPPYGGAGGYGYGGEPPRLPRKKGTVGLVVAIVLLVVGLALLIGAGVVFFQSQQAYNENAAEYEGLAETNVTEDVSTGQPIVDFAALQLQNPEIVGWIQIPNTPVNYPVVQHADNEYYLNHSFLGRYDEFGAVFMDYRSPSDLTGRNTVLYGHHLQNGNMFARVADYSDQAEFDTLQNIYYVTSDGQVHVLVPLCCMVVDGYDVDSIQFSFADQASFETYVQSLIDRSSARSATATAAGVERIFMLSTCSYARENDRTILVCVDLNGTNGPVLDATQSIDDIQAAADEAVQQATA